MNQLTINKDYSKSFFIAKVLCRLPFCSKISTIYNEYRHTKIKKQLMPIFDYSAKLTDKMVKKQIHVESDIIWILWWKGRDKMTPLTQKCYQSILKNKGKRKVILITKDNVKKYARLPEYIYSKLNTGNITYTHFSDILRFNLLSIHGGLWIDATIYAAGELDKFKINSFFTLSGYNDPVHFNVSDGRWTGFLMGGPSHTEIFEFMDIFFKVYWKYNNKLIDYFLIDYALDYAWNHNFSHFKGVTYKNSKIAVNLFDLQPILNQTFEIANWKKLVSNTIVFKLSNRKKIQNNHATYYWNLL